MSWGGSRRGAGHPNFLPPWSFTYPSPRPWSPSPVLPSSTQWDTVLPCTRLYGAPGSPPSRHKTSKMELKWSPPLRGPPQTSKIEAKGTKSILRSYSQESYEFTKNEGGNNCGCGKDDAWLFWLKQLLFFAGESPFGSGNDDVWLFWMSPLPHIPHMSLVLDSRILPWFYWLSRFRDPQIYQFQTDVYMILLVSVEIRSLTSDHLIVLGSIM